MAIEKGGIMFNRVIQRVLLAVSLVMPASFTYADNHESDNPFIGGGITIIDLVAENPNEYIEQQLGNSQIFEKLGTSLAGVCTAVSGNDFPGEMRVYALFTSLADAFAMWDVMLTDEEIVDLQRDFSSSRELIGNQTLQIVKGLEGEIFEDPYGIRILNVNPSNPAAYLRAVTNLEEAFHANGFDRIQFDVHRPIASGDIGYYTVIAIAPSLRMLGEAFAALTSEAWARDAYSLVTASRSSPVSDKAYRCQPLYTAE